MVVSVARRTAAVSYTHLDVYKRQGQEPLDQSIQVTASDDLKNWRTVQDGGRLVELQNNGERIFKNRIDLDPVKAKYLRLVSLRREQRGLLSLIHI